jgi:hypothetical protein
MLRPLDIEDELLADTIIERLNRLLEDPYVRADIETLIETRVPCSKATLDHPTIQAVVVEENGTPTIGLLGLLNGLVGVDPRLVGPRRGWGYIAANFDDDMKLTNFQRVKNAEQPQG